MDKVKLAMVGCGGIGNWHLGRLKTYEDVEFVGFNDIIPERADKMVAATGQGKRYDNYLAMLDEGKPDALYICVPPAEHGFIEFEAIKRGIHLLVQKPISTSLKLAQEISDAITKAGIITSVGFQDRYLDIVENLKEYIKGRDIGLISGAWVGGIPGVPWWRTRATSGGQIVEQNIHLFDMLRYLIGEPATVYTAAGKGIVKPGPELEGYDVEDYSSAVVTFKNGMIANLFTGDYLKAGGGVRNGLCFYASDCTVEYDLRHKVKATGMNINEEVFTKVDQGIALDRTFIEAVKSGDASAIRSPYADAVKTLAFTLACNTSIDNGTVVHL